MSLDPSSPLEYLVGHIEDALARDPRVSEQGLSVTVAGEPLTVVVMGTVVNAKHRQAVAEVIRELLPGAAVQDETVAGDYPESGGTEHVP